MSRVVDLGDVRFVRQVERLHRLGPRATGEFLAELGADHFLATEIEVKIVKFIAALDPDVLAVVGGDCVPPIPLHLVPR
jgi:hypothetical protein